MGASRPGQAVCVVPGRSGFGRGLAHWSAMDGERQPGAVCWEPCGCVEWFGTAPRKGRPRESPRNSSRTGSPRNSTRLSSSAAAGGVVNQGGAPSCGKVVIHFFAEKSLHFFLFFFWREIHSVRPYHDFTQHKGPVSRMILSELVTREQRPEASRDNRPAAGCMDIGPRISLIRTPHSSGKSK